MGHVRENIDMDLVIFNDEDTSIKPIK